jgi:hypothetical protein
MEMICFMSFVKEEIFGVKNGFSRDIFFTQATKNVGFRETWCAHLKY